MNQNSRFKRSFHPPFFKFFLKTGSKYAKSLKNNNDTLYENFTGSTTRILHSYSYWEANQLTFRV